MSRACLSEKRSLGRRGVCAVVNRNRIPEARRNKRSEYNCEAIGEDEARADNERAEYLLEVWP